jgi:pimeloyl-ACP methyl ester carboxylesterase
MELNYKTYGRGEPLIILHGLLGSSDNWQPMSAKLGEFFHVFALDQRNHGGSAHSVEMNYEVMAKDINEFLNREHLEQGHILGHSMGGKTAMEFAQLFPEKVSKLIIVDIAPKAYPPNHQKILAALMEVEVGSYETRKQVENALAPSIPELALRRFLLKNLARDSIGGFRWKIGLREIHQNYNRLGEAIRSERPLEKPALFIRGERSEYLRGQDMPEILRLFPRARLQTIAGAGHLAHAENPPAFAETVLEFLREGESNLARKFS